MNCAECGRPLSADEIGANRKFLGPRRESFLCLSCLADGLGADEERLKEKIEEYRRMGCVFFAPLKAAEE